MGDLQIRCRWYSSGGVRKKLKGSVPSLKVIRRAFPHPEKGWRVYVLNLRTIFEWDGAQWQEVPKTNISYMIALAAKEFGWTVPQILDMTPIELRTVLGHLKQIHCEAAIYQSLAFHDPAKIQSELEEINDRNLSPRERWRKGISRMKEAMKR